MSRVTRGERLARRYPVLRKVPENERPVIVRAALRHPLMLLLVVGGGMLLLPLYFRKMLGLIAMDGQHNLLLQFAFYAGIVLLPVLVAVPLLTRFVLPRILRKEMIKRGYSPDDAPKDTSDSDGNSSRPGI